MTLNRHPNGHFMKGSGGRQAGSKNKLHAKVFDSLLKEWEAHGDEVLRIVRIEKPDVWLRVVTSVLPREVMFTDDRISELTDDEIRSYLEALPPINSQKVLNG